MKRTNFTEITERFKRDNPNYARTPNEKYSSSRMGGWLLKDANNQYIGFASYKGSYQLVDLVETTPENKPSYRGEK